MFLETSGRQIHVNAGKTERSLFYFILFYFSCGQITIQEVRKSHMKNPDMHTVMKLVAIIFLHKTKHNVGDQGLDP